MDPINPIAGNPEAVNLNPNTKTPPDNHWVSILAMAIFILFSLGVVAFLYYQNQQLKNMLASYQPQATPAATASPTPNPELPVVSSPSANMKVVSPLKITGTVPAGWMFEGTFPIKLQQDNGKLIAQGQAKEIVPGSWQSGKPVDFTATLTFTKTFLGMAFLILEKDNPSGNPSNSNSHSVPVWLNCAPRPECLDSVPKCSIPETKDMCPTVFYY